MIDVNIDSFSYFSTITLKTMVVTAKLAPDMDMVEKVLPYRCDLGLIHSDEALIFFRP